MICLSLFTTEYFGLCPERRHPIIAGSWIFLKYQVFLAFSLTIPSDISGPFPAELYEGDLGISNCEGEATKDSSVTSLGTLITSDEIHNKRVRCYDLLRFHEREKMAVEAGQDAFFRPCHRERSREASFGSQEVFLCRILA